MTIKEATDIAADLLPSARLWARRTGTRFDDEIQQTVAASLLDLNRVGVVNIVAANPLIQQAVKLYVKAHFGFSDESEKYARAYESLRDSMSLCSDYSDIGLEE